MTSKNLKKHSELVEISKKMNLGFGLEILDGMDFLKMTNHFHPFSLRETEANIVYDIIINNNLKFGYEVATAFGISSCVMGQALCQTNGKLVSIDSYVEESLGTSTSYTHETRIDTDGINSDGYNMAKGLIESLGIENNVYLEIGWSPDDNRRLIEKHFTEQLDFIFIDGGHSEAQIDLDVKNLLPFLKTKSIIFFHDYSCMGSNTIEYLKENDFTRIKDYNTGFNLVVHARGTDWKL